MDINVIANIILILSFIYALFLVLRSFLKKNKINKKNIVNLNKEDVEKYQDLILKDKEINKYKKRMDFYNIRIICLLFGSIISFIIIFFVVFDSFLLIFIFIIILIFCLDRLFWMGLSKKIDVHNISQIYVSKIMTKLIKKYNPDYKYYIYQGIDKQMLLRAKLIDQYDDCFSNNLITGRIDNCDFQMAKTVIIEKNKSNNDSKYSEKYNGIFSTIQLNKIIDDEIIITKDTLLNGEKNVIIDNEEFESVFNVYSKNRIMALRILTSDFTSEIMDIYNNCGFDFSLNISKNTLYIFFFVPDMFEFDLKESNEITIDCIKNMNIIKNIDLYIQRIVKSINALSV